MRFLSHYSKRVRQDGFSSEDLPITKIMGKWKPKKKRISDPVKLKFKIQYTLKQKRNMEIIVEEGEISFGQNIYRVLDQGSLKVLYFVSPKRPVAETKIKWAPQLKWALLSNLEKQYIFDIVHSRFFIGDNLTPILTPIPQTKGERVTPFFCNELK